MNQRAGLYLRLSRDDGPDRVSESIKNQEDFLVRYAQEHGFEIVEIYREDDGYTGTNFARPGFGRMISDIEKKRIDTVITKDLSRLGRDYIGTGYYMEQYFPMHNIRFIAVADGIDTACRDDGMNPFRAVFNDMYAKDISKKVRASLDSKRYSGKFIGSAAPYGYQKDPEDKNHLIVDEETAHYVRYMYRLFLDGYTLRAIANRLSEEQIPTPSQKKGICAEQKRFSGTWNEAMVKRILTSETYIGNLTQNRVTKVNYKVKKRVRRPMEDWIVVENTHEAVVSRDMFDAVQERMAKRRYEKRSRSGGEHVLSGLVKCADCGSPMTFVCSGGGYTYLVCSGWKRHAKLGVCTSHCIREDMVLGTVQAVLRDITSETVDMDELKKSVSDTWKERRESTGGEEMGLQELERIQKILMQLYQDKAEGRLCEEEYLELLRGFREKREALQKRQDKKMEIRIDCEEEINKRVEEILNFEAPDGQILKSLVKEIEVDADKNLTIHFWFQSPQKIS
jgi:site-specific DNA recombinase